MAAIFSKGLDEIKWEDVDELVREQQPETDTVELKEALPSKKERDGWYSGAPQLSDYARNQLLKEVVAFANAHGGSLIVGIEESDDHPHRAVGLASIPRCLELAERLKLQIRDCIEPTIPVVSVRGIPKTSNGDGVILVRLPQSRAAPHRLKTNNECYYRHADRTEVMTMRDIQDLTIQRMRMSEQLDELFVKRHQSFESWISSTRPDTGTTVGCRVTLIPTSAIYAGNLFRNNALVPRDHKFEIQFENGGRLEAFVPSSPTDERPIVRGTRRLDHAPNPNVVQEAHNSGLLEFCFRETERHPRLFVSWVIGVLCNGLLMADAFRKGVGAPDVEYAFELEIAATSPHGSCHGHRPL